MNQRHVPDGDIGTDIGSVRLPGDVDDGAVLDVGAFADADLVYVTTKDATEPDVGVRSDLDVADHRCGRGNEDAVGDARLNSPIRQ